MASLSPMAEGMVIRTTTLVLSLLAVQVAVAASPDVGLVDSIVLPQGKGDAAIPVVVFAEGPDVIAAAVPDAVVEVLDVPAPGTVKVAYAEPEHLSTTQAPGSDGKLHTTRIEWRTTASVTGLPRETTVSRDAVLRVGNVRRRFRFEISNKSTPLTWTLNGPTGALRVSDKPFAVPLAVSGSGNGRGTVSVARYMLRDAETDIAVPAGAITVQGSEAAAGSIAGLELQIDGSKLSPGTYTGVVELALSGASDTKPFDLTVHRSAPCDRLRGFFALLVGIVVAWVIAGVLRAAWDRNVALRPAVRLREILDGIEQRMKTCGVDSVAPNVRSEIASRKKELEPVFLTNRKFVPPMIPQPWRVTLDVEGYAALLDSIGKFATVASTLVERGFCPVRKMEKDGMISGPDASAAYEKLDGLVAQTPETIAGEVAKIVNGIQLTQKATDAGVVFDAGREVLSVEQLLVQANVISAVVWVLWAIITAVAGYLAVIATDHGFGTTEDLMKAFLWGLGVQISGTSLQTLTPGSVSTAIGVSLPKGD